MGSLRVLVTGAAGLIGSELCGALADRGHGVVGLVHRSRGFIRNDGSKLNTVRATGGSPLPGTFTWLEGDVCVPGLGLDDGFFRDGLDLVVHCAALTDFAASEAQYQSVNVEGTANVAAFALRVGAGLVHVSTAYVCGDRSGPVQETWTAGARFANAYEASKDAAERRAREGDAPVATVRPSIVVGRSGDGALSRFENIYAFLKLIGSGRIGTLPATSGASLDLVPIDHVVGGIVDVAERFEAAVGRVFHLVSRAPTTVADLVALDYPGFRVPRLVAPESFDVAVLPTMEAYLYAGVTARFESYLRRDPRFIAENLSQLSGRTCPPTGPGFLRRLVAYAVRAGYLAPDPDLIGRPDSDAQAHGAGRAPSERRP